MQPLQDDNLSKPPEIYFEQLLKFIIENHSTIESEVNGFTDYQIELENNFQQLISRNIFNPKVDIILISLINHFNSNSALLKTDYLDYLILWIVTPIYYFQLNRLVGLNKREEYFELIKRYNKITSYLKNSKGFTLHPNQIDGNFMPFIYQILQSHGANVVQQFVALLNQIKENPEKILIHFENSEVYSASFPRNIYMLLKHSIRLYVMANPIGTEKFNRLKQLLNSGLNQYNLAISIAKLVLTVDLMQLGWYWIDKYHSNENLDIYDPERPLKEKYIELILNSRLNDFAKKIAIWVDFIESIDKYSAKIDYINDVKNFIDDFITETSNIIRLSTGYIADKDKTKQLHLNALDTNTMQRLLVLLI